MDKVTFLSVLRSGGDYGLDYVSALWESLCLLHKDPIRYVVFTDVDPLKFPRDIHVYQLRDKFPGWWSKIELFNHKIWEQAQMSKAIYLDLDTILLDPIDDLYDFVVPGMIEDVWKPGSGKLQSGVMQIPASFTGYVYQKFMQMPDYYMGQYSGDGDFIESAWSIFDENLKPRVIQHTHPGWVISGKDRITRNIIDAPPTDARIVCFHGQPRIRDIAHSTWVGNFWRPNDDYRI